MNVAAVGQVQIAVAIDVADVADRPHRAVGRERRLGLLGVVEVFELRPQPEPHGADRARRHFAHLLVEDMQFAEQRPGRPCPMRQPFGAVAGGEAHAFGHAVVLEDDRSPPVDHLLA